MKIQVKIVIFVLIILVIGFYWGFVIWETYYKTPRAIALIRTDKTEYQPGENLKIKIKNNFKEQICFSSCYPYLLEKKNGEWKNGE